MKPFKPKASFLVVVFALFFINAVFSTNLRIEQEEILIREDATGPYLTYLLTVTWENSWKNQRNHDAVWLFFKIGNQNNTLHARVMKEGHQYYESINSKGPRPNFYVPEDQIGLFLSPSLEYRGSIKWRLSIRLELETLEQLQGGIFSGEYFGKAFGLEMVYIPEGAFTLGDPDSKAPYFASFYESNENGEPHSLFSVDSESEITVAPQRGSLYYKTNQSPYRGDQQGPIPSEYPKGYRSFYIMKYELLQGQYAEFLNALSDDQTQNRANFSGKEYYAQRGSITIEKGKYSASKPLRPANYCSWDDGMAYADWAGLRPITEFEYTKAARGPKKPIASEFPWGTESRISIQRYINLEGDLDMAEGLEESMLSNDNLELFGASHYWVMDLSGSLWERVITLGHHKGRSFVGSHGDGMLSEYGFATNKDWPIGMGGDGGIGFRGGGFYYHEQNYTDINPHSPIAFRPYGAWHGWNRAIAYGQRFARTVE